jgi:uncharacterized protein (TIGR03435 family)
MMRVAALFVVAVLQTTATPQFEVATIKSCGAADPGFRGGGPTQFSPDRVAINCQILKGLIQQAYIARANAVTDQSAVLRTPIEGAPDWISSERYSITAKSSAETTQAVMMGPMLRALLEDRFKLKIRRLTREIPTWDLVIAKGGPKLTPFQEGSCVSVTPSFPPAPPVALPPGQRACRNLTQFRGTSMVTEADAVTMDDLVKVSLFLAAGRPITNKTGLTGKFTVHLEYAPPEGTRLNGQQSDPTESTAPSIFTALQEQLGLKLESSKGPGEYLIVDHVERPAEN